jgi:hypothetical protein
MSQPTVSGVAPPTGITLSDEDVRENARSAAVMDDGHRLVELPVLRADLGDRGG